MLFAGKKFDTILFDMDGTVLNSLDDLADSVNYALASKGYATRELAEVRSFIGNGVENLMMKAVPEGTERDEMLSCLEVFRAHYNANKENKTAPYKGIVRLLEGLRERGYKTGIVSNKYDGAVKALSDKYFGGLIQVAIGEGPDTARKPSPDGILKAMEQLGGQPETTLYVGDSAQDILTAKRAGVASCGVLWGFRDREELEAAGADFLADRAYKIWNVLMACEDGLHYEPMWEQDYGEVVLEGGQIPFIYYNQSDLRWKHEPVGETGGTMADDGCGPACLAMVVDSLKGEHNGILAVADWIFKNGHFAEGIGCYHRIAEEGAKHYGLTCEAVGSDWEKLKAGLQAGKAAIAVVKRGHFSGGGHFIVIRGMTADGMLLVADPGSIYRSEAPWKKEAVFEDLNLNAGSGGPLWLLGRG